MNWPDMKDYLISSLIKVFNLKNGGDDMTLGMIWPDNREEVEPAIFTEMFFDGLSSSTKFGKNLFFTVAGSNGYISECSGEVRWLFSEGVAIGYKYCRFFVFNDFTDRDKYQGEELTDKMIDEFEDRLWNSGW